MLRLVLLNCKPVSLPREQNFGYFQIPLFLIPKTAIHYHPLFLSPTMDTDTETPKGDSLERRTLVLLVEDEAPIRKMTALLWRGAIKA